MQYALISYKIISSQHFVFYQCLWKFLNYYSKTIASSKDRIFYIVVISSNALFTMSARHVFVRKSFEWILLHAVLHFLDLDKF